MSKASKALSRAGSLVRRPFRIGTFSRFDATFDFEMQVPVLWLPPVALTYFLLKASYVTVSSGQHESSSGMSRRQPYTKAVWQGSMSVDGLS